MSKQATKAPPATEVPTNASTDQDYLKRIDARIRGLKVNNPDSSELQRMEAARKDVAGRLSAKELAAYEKAASPAKSKQQLKDEAEAERLAMDANKDKPAI